MFLTYTHADSREERMVWMTHDGQVMRDEWEDLGDVLYACANNDTVVIADYESEVVGNETNYHLYVREFAPDGALLNEQTVMEDMLSAGRAAVAFSFDDRNSTMTGALFVVNFNDDPATYEMRAFRYDSPSNAATVYQHVPITVPSGSYVDWWAIDDGPAWADALLLAYHVVSLNGGYFLYQSYEGDLSLSGERFMEQPQGQTTNGLEILEHGGTVYTAFTALSTDSLLRGCWLAGFPLDEILDAEPRAVLPSQFQLLSFPNPFNNSVTIRLTIPGTQLVTVRIFDTLGRELATLAENAAMSGVRDFSWDASAQASGIYLLRVESAVQSHTEKMVLLK